MRLSTSSGYVFQSREGRRQDRPMARHLGDSTEVAVLVRLTIAPPAWAVSEKFARLTMAMSTSVMSRGLAAAGAWRFLTMAGQCIAEARPSVLGVHLIRFAAGAGAGARIAGRLHLGAAVAGAVTWEMAIFAIYLLNGVMDVHEDRVNGSRRPIASGALPRRVAAWWAAGAAAVSVACALAEGTPRSAAVIVVLALGWQYSASPGALKRRVAGVAVVGAALGFSAYFVGFTSQAGSDWSHPASGPIAFAITMSAWMAFIGAPAKDLSDVPGDAAAGRRTLPVLWGEAATRRGIAVAAVVIAVAFCAAATYDPRLLRWPAATVAAGASSIALLSLTRTAAGSRLPYKCFMLTQYAANICMLLATAALLGHRHAAIDRFEGRSA